jgi:flagellar export protein FliJ
MTPAIKTLQRLRQLELDRCRIALGNARRLEGQVQERLDAAIIVRTKQLKDLESRTSAGPVSVSTIRVRHEHLSVIGAQVQELQNALAVAVQDVQLQRDALVSAERQLKVAEKLQQRSARQ